MKRFLVFASQVYYPGGGWEDFLQSCDTLDEAKAAAAAYQSPDFGAGFWWHVVDRDTLTIVAKGN